MAYDAPSSEIYLIKNCPLDIGREHTIKFATPSAQFSYFTDPSRALHFFGQYTRINPLDNTIRVGLPYARVYECNYVAFNNASLLQEQKWYYGFITKVNYINEGTTEIEYSLDYMQTYLFDFEVLPCLVEREHTATDNVGENIVPEGLDIGEYVLNKTHKNGNTTLNPNGYIPCHMGDAVVYILITSRDLLQHYTQGTPWTNLTIFYPVGNVFSGVGVYVIEDAETLGNVLTDMSTETDSIAAVFPFPSALIDWGCAHWGSSQAYPITKKIARLYDDNGGTSVRIRPLNENVTYTDGNGNIITPHVAINIPKFMSEHIDGYMPWNNKLYTAPFCWIEVDTKTGTTGLFRPEFFESAINFGFMSAPSAEPVIMVYPKNYRGMTDNQEEGISKNNAYPYCAYQYDTFKIWLQQNRGSLALSFAEGAVGGLLSAASTAVGRSSHSFTQKHSYGELPVVEQKRDEKGRFVKGMTKGTQTIDMWEDQTRDVHYKNNPYDIALHGTSGLIKSASTLASIGDHSMIPNSIRGQVNNGSINQANDINDFYIYIKTLRREYAQKIDDYFSRFGYAVNKFEVPNLFAQNGRPRRRWNYVKTVDAKIHAKNTTGFALDIEANLEALFNKGVTFWNIENGDMYDYSQTANNNNKPN